MITYHFGRRRATAFTGADWIVKGLSQNKEEQIEGTQDESQQIVAQRLLSCLQYPEANKSSANDLSAPQFGLAMGWQTSLSRANQRTKSACAISLHVTAGLVDNVA